jgi:iron complex outermembrane receptor protein
VAGQGAVFRNMAKGRSRGLEMWGRWQVIERWRLTGGLVQQDIQTRTLPGSLDVSAATGLGINDPSHYWSLRSSHDLADDLQADFMLRHVGSLPQPALPAYTELDARLAWQPRRNLELSLAGQNLLQSSHAEFGAPAMRQVFGRAVALKLALRF